MKLAIWNLAWLIIGPATLAGAIFGTDAAYRAAKPEPKLASFGDGEEGFSKWENAHRAWYDKKESLSMQILIGTAVLDIVAYAVIRRTLVVRRDVKPEQPNSQAE